MRLIPTGYVLLAIRLLYVIHPDKLEFVVISENWNLLESLLYALWQINCGNISETPFCSISLMMPSWDLV
jgi:hypothetical protein